MNAIVVVDKKWGIGKNNDLLFKLPEEMKYFRQKTLNKIVVMGSNTLKSFPDGKPLKNRTNAVLFPGGEKRDDCIVADSLEELRQVLTSFPEDDIFIIGGAMMYKTMLPFCKRVYVTKVDAFGESCEKTRRRVRVGVCGLFQSVAAKILTKRMFRRSAAEINLERRLSK